MSYSTIRRTACAAAALYAALTLAGCSSSEPVQQGQVPQTAPATLPTGAERPPSGTGPAPDPGVRSWPLPTLPAPAIDEHPDPSDAASVAAAWVQLVATHTGDQDLDDDLAARARRLSTSDDTLRVQLLASTGVQTARIVDAAELAPDERGGVVVAVAADVGQPGQRPTVATVRLRLERTTARGWLVDEVLA
jgi:hypothetical protein